MYHLQSGLVGFPERSLVSLVRTIRHILHLAVLFLQLPLHLEIGLSFALDALLLHVPNHAYMHSLMVQCQSVRLLRFRLCERMVSSWEFALTA